MTASPVIKDASGRNLTVRKPLLRDCCVGALVFGFAGPFFGAAPFIALFAVMGMLGGFHSFGIMGFVDVLLGGWAYALFFGALPGVLTGLIRAIYSRRLDASSKSLLTIAVGAVTTLAYLLLIGSAAHLHGLEPTADDPPLIFFGVLPVLWAVPLCERLTRAIDAHGARLP